MSRTTKKRTAPSSLGTVRKRSSGRYSASYRVDGRQYSAPRTFATKEEAVGWLATERADRLRGAWQDPHAGQIPLSSYLRDWLASKSPRLSQRTATTYARSIERWILPRLVDDDGKSVELGQLHLGQVTTATVRRWFAILSDATRAAALARLTYTPEGHPARLWAQDHGHDVPATGRLPRTVVDAWRAAGAPLPAPRLRPGAEHIDAGHATATAAYATLHAALSAAVDDGLITTNPCRLRGASSHTPHERGTCSPDEVLALADAMPPHLRAAVFVAAWGALRQGELFALARRHVDLQAGTIRVERALTVDGRAAGRTKTRGSVRTVYLPRFVVDELARHMARHTGHGPEALLFVTASGRPYNASSLARVWHRARCSIGRPELHWHDLRHTGATLAYREGASVKDVQRRLGHTTARAAMIYAHAADESDALLAQRLNDSYGQVLQFPRKATA